MCHIEGCDDDMSLPGALSRAQIYSGAHFGTIIILQGYSKDIRPTYMEDLHKYELKDDFERLKEVVLVLQRDDDPDDNMKIRFEHNLIVNGKRICNVKRSFLKSSEMVKECLFANYCVELHAKMEEGISKDFLFEMSDLGNEVY